MSQNFLQSINWLNFQRALGRQGWLIRYEDTASVVIKYDLPLKKSYLYCPYGPNIFASALDFLIEEINKIAKNEGVIFFRCDPRDELPLETKKFIKAPDNYDLSAVFMPRNIAVLDLTASEEDIWQKAKPKNRYNINLARRRGLIIEQSDDLVEFYQLICRTAQRQGVMPQPMDHYRKLAESFQKQIKIFFVQYQNKKIATAMILFWGDTATYLHGGADFNYRQLMAPHLLHWEMIKQAKNDGYQFYDLGGITLFSNHPWAGITRFKLGFGAQVRSSGGAYDLIFQPFWYNLYNLLRRFRKKC